MLLDPIVSNILLAISTFAMTNVDDLLILSIYFAMPQARVRQIVLGQYIGVMALVMLGLLGHALGTVLQQDVLRYLGLVPLVIGLKGLYALFKKKPSATEYTPSPAPESTINCMSVAFVTIANGADNIGVYIPLFAKVDSGSIFLFIAVSVVMIAVWCLTAYYLVKHRAFLRLFERYGTILLPLFLMCLGAWILWN